MSRYHWLAAAPGTSMGGTYKCYRSSDDNLRAIATDCYCLLPLLFRRLQIFVNTVASLESVWRI